MTKVSRPQGGEEIRIDTGGKITAAGVQAAHIANVTTGGGSGSAGNATAINAILVALRGVGILAPS
jgi:hypothetical protein